MAFYCSLLIAWKIKKWIKTYHTIGVGATLVAPKAPLHGTLPDVYFQNITKIHIIQVSFHCSLLLIAHCSLVILQ